MRLLRGTSRQALSIELGWDDLKTRRLNHKLILYFKIVRGTNPSYLRDLIPLTVQQRSGLVLRSARNFSLFPVRTESYKNSFFPSTTRLWNGIDDSIRETKSLGIFKKSLTKLYCVQSSNSYLNVAIDRYSSILHTRLRINCCALNYHLFKVNCSISQACACRAPCESVIHYLLHCPRYAALRQNLLSAAAHLLKDRWSNLLDFQKCYVFLLGSNDMTYDDTTFRLI